MIGAIGLDNDLGLFASFPVRDYVARIVPIRLYANHFSCAT